MTPEQQLTIRAELARRMGWTYHAQTRYWIDPSDSHDYSFPPDPFINAEDKDALVAWLASDWIRWKKFFSEFTSSVIPAMTQSEAYLARTSETDNFTIGPSQAEWGWALMTASRETITLAAARALKIIE